MARSLVTSKLPRNFVLYMQATETTSPSNDPPAEPEALRLLAPQRGLIATGQNQYRYLVSAERPNGNLRSRVKHTPGTVKLLLPPRQSRGISQVISARQNELFVAVCPGYASAIKPRANLAESKSGQIWTTKWEREDCRRAGSGKRQPRTLNFSGEACRDRSIVRGGTQR